VTYYHDVLERWLNIGEGIEEEGEGERICTAHILSFCILVSDWYSCTIEAADFPTSILYLETVLTTQFLRGSCNFVDFEYQFRSFPIQHIAFYTEKELMRSAH
jgi:hypothetical protein